MKKLYANFHNAILENDAALAAGDLKPGARMEIYIEGYRIRLLSAVRSDYPALDSYLGADKFNEIANAYIEKFPSTNFNLDKYPHNFAGFFKSEDKFAVELATLESAIAKVFMMEESTPLNPASLGNITEEDFANFIFKARAASMLMEFEYDVNNWLNFQRAGKVKEPLREKNYLYIYRHNNSVQREVLSAPAYKLLQKLVSGKKISEALDETEAANLQQWFAEWLSKGFFAE